MAGTREVTSVAAAELRVGQVILWAGRVAAVQAVYRDLTRDDVVHVSLVLLGGAPVVIERGATDLVDVLEGVSS